MPAGTTHVRVRTVTLARLRAAGRRLDAANQRGCLPAGVLPVPLTDDWLIGYALARLEGHWARSAVARARRKRTVN